jgi:ribosome-binding factor A
VYGSDAERADSAAALDSAKGVIRTEVGRRTGVRHTPSLTFVPDALPENARQIDHLLAKARAADEQVAKAAEGALPAGEANPYREARSGADVDETDGDDADNAGYSGS